MGFDVGDIFIVGLERVGDATRRLEGLMVGQVEPISGVCVLLIEGG